MAKVRKKKETLGLPITRYLGRTGDAKQTRVVVVYPLVHVCREKRGFKDKQTIIKTQ